MTIARPNTTWLACGLLGLAIGLSVWCGGCGDFFAEKATELEAERALSDLTGVRPFVEPNVPRHPVYETPPEISRQVVSGVEEYKLFYFCKYHTSDKLRQIIHDQFATQLFDEKGKSTNVKDYTVTSNPATNQLIVRCPTLQDVEAVLEVLEKVDVPPIQVRIDCIVSEVYADMTMDREVTDEITKLFGEDIFIGGKRSPDGTELWPAFPGAALREVARSRFGLKVGYASERFKTLIDILQSKGYLKVLMNPSLEIVNAQTAKIVSSEHVPLEQVTTMLPKGGEYIIESRTEYVDVIDSLEITPYVFADGYIALQTVATISSKNTPHGVKQVPIVTKREITNKENRIRQGESLIIGGIRKTERFAVVRGVPFLKDLPVLGILFSSKDFEERAKETIFILTPTISTGGQPPAEITERLRRDHEPPVPAETLNEAITDPFGFAARQREQELGILESERARLEAEREKATARAAIRAAEQKTALAQQQAQRAIAAAQKLKQEAERAKAEAEAKAKAAEQAKAAADKAIAEAAAAKAQAEKIAADSTAAKQEAERAKAEAEAKAKAAEQAKAAADKALAEAEAAKAQAQAKARAAEQAQKEADGGSPEGQQPPSAQDPNE
ncbi:MAG: hypothetical protein QHH07_03670 [Sedimentisphaerales bacterium]|nr:hypothetical protein [Sedimentisphaerales bacterium]